MFDLTLQTLFILSGVGFFAGLIEASAGGAGLLITPVLLMLGFSPAQTVATSKLQYEFGALVAILRFRQAKLLDWKRIAPMAIVSAIAGAIGALILIHLRADILGVVVPFLLMGVAFYFALSPRLSDVAVPAKMKPLLFALGLVPLIALYDGFFSVGSASFYMLAMVWGLGLSARQATATTRVVDFVGSTAALLVLMIHGQVLWLPALALGLGQILGAWIGAGLVIRKGAKFIRPMLIAISLILSAKLLFDHSETILKWLSWT